MAEESLSEKITQLVLTALGTVGILFAITPIHELAGVPRWVACTLLIPSAAIFAYLCRRIQHGQRARMEVITAGRPSLSAQQFASTYFSGPAVAVAARCHELFANYYKYDASRLLPDDKLCEELRFAAHDCLDADELLLAIEREYQMQFSESEAKNMRTLRDIVQAVLLHTKPKFE